MTQPPPIPEWLVADITRRDAERLNAAADFYATLTDRERALVRDAAVMGYVLGRMDERAHAEFPKDTPITRAVVYAALREDENYAVLRGIAHHYTEPEDHR